MWHRKPTLEQRAAWHLQSAMGLAAYGVYHDQVLPVMYGTPGDLESLHQAITQRSPELVSPDARRGAVAVLNGLIHARAGRRAEAIESWRRAEPSLARVTGTSLTDWGQLTGYDKVFAGEHLLADNEPASGPSPSGAG
jgi:hypothetical protein